MKEPWLCVGTTLGVITVVQLICFVNDIRVHLRKKIPTQMFEQ